MFLLFLLCILESFELDLWLEMIFLLDSVTLPYVFIHSRKKSYIYFKCMEYVWKDTQKIPLCPWKETRWLEVEGRRLNLHSLLFWICFPWTYNVFTMEIININLQKTIWCLWRFLGALPWVPSLVGVRYAYFFYNSQFSLTSYLLNCFRIAPCVPLLWHTHSELFEGRNEWGRTRDMDRRGTPTCSMVTSHHCVDTLLT